MCCEKCGEQINESANFCSNCGHRVCQSEENTIPTQPIQEVNMDKKEIIIDKNKLWSYNENFYTEEFCQKLREERQKDIQERLDKFSKKESEENPIIGSALREYEAEMRARGEIMSPFIKQNLEGKISVARWTLALAMAMTLLFKNFWVMWIVFILLYVWTVNRFKKEALAADMKRGKKHKDN